MTKIPSDPAILLSFINTQLRDFYPSLDELCSSLSIDRKFLDEKISAFGYEYDPDRNQYT